MKRALTFVVLIGCAALAQAPEPRTTFHIKHVAEGAVYLDGGRNTGLTEGMKLAVVRTPEGADAGGQKPIADIEVVAIAESSAVCEIKAAAEPVQPGDTAHLSAQDVETIRALRSFQGSAKYAQVVSFTEGDPLDEEARESIPRPPSPEVNRARGRIGFEYGAIRDPEGSGLGSSQVGLVFRGDVSRIGGTFWNLSGYWRGQRNVRTSGAREETLTDLLSRTYHLNLLYNNPQSRWVAGVGRLYLPWASSLETLDGGYIGRRLGKRTTTGVFAGSTPDPSSWNYNPDRQMLGSFINFEGGTFEAVRFSSTAGAGLARIRWRREREFAFFENGLFYKRYLSIYHNLEGDRFLDRRGSAQRTRVDLSRSFLTVRLQPHRILSLDFNHNYFRDVPTSDPRLVGSRLLDRLLFQGVSAGFRLDLPLRLSVYSSLGRSGRSGDTRRSLNQMYGVAMAGIWRTGLRADLRYSRFDSSFGRGLYRSLSLTREIHEVLRLEVQAGQQHFVSPLTGQNRARFLNVNLDWLLGSHYFLGSGYTIYRGRVQSYDQLFVSAGYRF